MSISEQSRHNLYSRLEAVLGREEAATLMEHLPPVGWADVATKRDLDVVRSDLSSEIAMVRSDMGMLRSDLRAEMAALRADLVSEIRSQPRNLFLPMLGLQVSAAGLVLAVARLL